MKSSMLNAAPPHAEARMTTSSDRSALLDQRRPSPPRISMR
jgi:hypothetical protein